MTRIAIIGAGAIGRTHLRHLARLQGVHPIVADLDRERASRVAQEFGVESAPSVADAITSSQAAVVAAPTSEHVELTQQCVEAGLPVLLEKPIAANCDQARRLVEASKGHGVSVMPAHVVRHFPAYVKARFNVRDGGVGKVAAVRTSRVSKPPVREANWYLDQAKSGGVLMDFAIHDFDWLLWTIGPCERVVARSNASGTFAVATLEFKCGAIGHVEASWMDVTGFQTRFEIAGSEGVLNFDSAKAGALSLSTESGRSVESGLTPDDDPYYRQISAFVTAVRSGAPMPVNIEEGFDAVALAEASKRSSETGNWTVPERL